MTAIGYHPLYVRSNYVFLTIALMVSLAFALEIFVYGDRRGTSLINFAISTAAFIIAVVVGMRVNGRAYVEIDDVAIRVSVGVLHYREIERKEVASVSVSRKRTIIKGNNGKKLTVQHMLIRGEDLDPFFSAVKSACHDVQVDAR